MITRSTSLTASGPLIRYLNSGETSMSAGGVADGVVLVLVVRSRTRSRRSSRTTRGSSGSRTARDVRACTAVPIGIDADYMWTISGRLRMRYQRDCHRRRAQRADRRRLSRARGPAGAGAGAPARPRRRGGDGRGVSRAFASPSARTSCRCSGRRSSASSICRDMGWRSCRSTARSRRCRTAIICGA